MTAARTRYVALTGGVGGAKLCLGLSHVLVPGDVAFVVNNASNRPSDVFEAVAATGTGRARELTGAEREAASEQYLAKHPHLKEFTTSPNCALVEVNVEMFHVVTRFQEVVEIRVG